MKKMIITAILVLITTMFISGCNSYNIKEPIIPIEKLNYARSLNFEVRMVMDNGSWISDILLFERLIPCSQSFDPFYTELVFIHSEAEAIGFSDNVILAWPRMGENYFSKGLIAGMHWQINPDNEAHLRYSGQMRDIITLEDFGLFYPLTVSDLVYNWRNVYALWRQLDYYDHSNIIWAAVTGWQ